LTTACLQGQNGTGFIQLLVAIDRLVLREMTCGVCHGTADIWVYARLCFFLK